MKEQVIVQSQTCAFFIAIYNKTHSSYRVKLQKEVNSAQKQLNCKKTAANAKKTIA